MTSKSFVEPFSTKTYQRRRAELIRKLSKISNGDFTALFWSGYEISRNSTNTFTFRANSDFLYLTGFSEPETLILLQQKNGKIRTAIGVRPRDFSNNRGSEIWDGERVGVERAPKALGFDEAFNSHDAFEVAKKWILQTPATFWSLGLTPDWDQKIIGIHTDSTAQMRGIVQEEKLMDPRPTLHEMRKIKSPEEIKAMKRAADIAAKGHIRAMKTTHPGHYEYEVQAEVEREIKKHGAQSTSYNSIVAAGNNACTLHYNTNRAVLKKHDLILIDAGAEYFGYASDITRCYPVSGTFTSAQKEVYSWVLKAQLTAIQTVRSGISFYKPHEEALKILCTALYKMGIFPKANPKKILKEGLYKPYFPHGTSHWLGMDVHDSGIYRKKDQKKEPVKLAPGNVLTIEPGLYFRADDRKVPARFRGIGIRIEDDVLVTKSGREVLSKNCPKLIQDIEALCGPKL
ncbi:MAG: Xaa-Pro aminopeptidase [Bacteriovoracaceae bacterium]|nr:Xaa-Pro aminopeptidase [Bacteriovoracaceae bacterium]